MQFVCATFPPHPKHLPLNLWSSPALIAAVVAVLVVVVVLVLLLA
jgi:hypothetical protein